MTKKITVGLWLATATLLFLFSFTQVDLGLTLTRASVFQGIQQSFQYIGYFNRSLSSVLYVSIIMFMFTLYLITLRQVQKNLYVRREVWAIILSVGIITFLSYNAFSYDIFNYIFDAKIVTFYNANPYEHRALDFPNDPMLSFMHWTHRTYPYGPVWLGITVPLSYMGLNYFIITYYLFKLLALGAFLGSAYFLEKILTKIKGTPPLLGLVFFALNPLIIIEFLVSAHNDITMIFFALISIYLLLIQRNVLSLMSLLISVGIKFATVFLIPMYVLFVYNKFRKRKIPMETLVILFVGTMLMPVILASVRTNFQPWYLIYILPFAAMAARKYFIAIPTMIVSFFSVLHYLPFLYTGNWDPPIPQILNMILLVSIVISAAVTGVWYLRYNKRLVERD